MNKTVILVGFPGIGMSYFAKRINPNLPKPFKILDLDESDYKKTELNWPVNYIKAVDEAYKSGTWDYIFVSLNVDLRVMLQRHNLPYIIVAPYLYGVEDDDQNQGIKNAKLRNEYKIRYLLQGKTVDYIYDIMQNWSGIIRGISKQSVPKIWLFEAYETLGTVFDRCAFADTDYSIVFESQNNCEMSPSS